MDNKELLNFFCEDEKETIKIDKYKTIAIFIIIMYFGFQNLTLQNKIDDLETYVEENSEYISVANIDSNPGSNNISTNEISKIIPLITDKNIQSIQIENNSLKISGYIVDSQSIKSYTQRLSKINNLSNTSIESINKEGELYKFEIKSTLGEDNEI